MEVGIFAVQMSDEPLQKRTLSEQLRDRYRLVILNDSSFEEKFVLKLKPLSLFILIGSVFLLFIILVISVIAFTPLREYIPGYADVKMRRSVIELAAKCDSMETELSLKSLYMENLKNVIDGKLPADSVESKKPVNNLKYKELINSNKPNKQDSMLRVEVESQESTGLSGGEHKSANSGISSFFFFCPLKGTVSNSFKSSAEHFGVDIVSKENEAIKATLDGTVISAAWTIEPGYTLEIQHSNNIVSVYKHCSTLMKRPGNFVKAGEVVGIVGNSGEQSTGPHLHFELWYNGIPIDPQDYMLF